MELTNRREEQLRSMLDIEFHPEVVPERLNQEGYRTIPFGALSALGGAIATLPESMRTAVSHMAMGDAAGKSGLYYVRVADGGHMAMKGGEYITATFADGTTNGLFAQARMKPAADVSLSNLMPYDPTLLVMGIALVELNHKLDTIQQGVKEILQFLELEKKAELIGSIHVLTDVLNLYKYNWDNEKYLAPKHNEVQSILTTAERDLIFYRERLEHLLAGKREKSGQLTENMKYYQLSIYLDGFARFLDVLLTRNFQAEYLKQVGSRLRSMDFQYRELYTRCYDWAQDRKSRSIGWVLKTGAAQISKGAGEMIGKIPVVSRGRLDENLIAAGEQFDRTAKRQMQQTMDQVKVNRDSGLNTFLDYTRQLDSLYNQPLTMYLSEEAVYVKAG